MTLNASGTLSIGGTTIGQSINIELARSATSASNINESPLRTLAGVASGQISINNFYGKAGTFILLAGGQDSAPGINRTIRYSYISFSSATSTNLTNNQGSRPQATNTSTTGYVYGGRGAGPDGSTLTTRYTYSNFTVAAGGALNVTRNDGIGFGNATVGILTNGLSNSYGTGTSTSSSYNYSTNVCSASTAIIAVEYDMPTAGSISTLGYIAFNGGSGTAASRRWTFSNASVTVASVLDTGQNAWAGQCTSTTTNAYFQWNQTNQIGKGAIYNYSGNTVSTMTTITYTFGPRSAGGDGTIGLYFGGGTAVNSYTYSNATVTARTALIISVADWAACSSPPGSF